MGTCFGVVVHSRLGGSKQKYTAEMDARVWSPQSTGSVFGRVACVA